MKKNIINGDVWVSIKYIIIFFLYLKFIYLNYENIFYKRFYFGDLGYDFMVKYVY